MLSSISERSKTQWIVKADDARYNRLVSIYHYLNAKIEANTDFGLLPK